jgi:hypothetical protein
MSAEGETHIEVGSRSPRRLPSVDPDGPGSKAPSGSLQSWLLHTVSRCCDHPHPFISEPQFPHLYGRVGNCFAQGLDTVGLENITPSGVASEARWSLQQGHQELRIGLILLLVVPKHPSLSASTWRFCSSCGFS